MSCVIVGILGYVNLYPKENQPGGSGSAGSNAYDDVNDALCIILVLIPGAGSSWILLDSFKHCCHSSTGSYGKILPAKAQYGKVND